MELTFIDDRSKKAYQNTYNITNQDEYYQQKTGEALGEAKEDEEGFL